MDQSSSEGRKGPSNRNQNRNRNRNRNRGGNRSHQNRSSSKKPEAKKKESLGAKILGFFGVGKKKNQRKSSGNRQSSRPPGNKKSRRPAEIAEPTSGRLYIGNLDYGVKGPELAEFFKKAGNVVSAEVITNPHNGRSKGFGFVEMGSIEEAKKAVQSLQNQELNGRQLLVSGAKSKPTGERREREPRRQQGDRPPRRDSSSRGGRSGGDRPRNDRERRGRKRYDDEPPVERKPRKVETVTGTALQVGNLNTEATEDDLRDIFRDISPVTSVMMAGDDAAKGTARVEFASVEEAQQAVNILHGKSFMGRQLALTNAS